MAVTFSAPATSAWVETVSGASYARVGIQYDSRPVFVFIGTNAPSDDTQDYMILGRDNAPEMVVDLSTEEKVFVRSSNKQAMTVGVRGYREVR